LSKGFPKEETCSLTDQMRRSSRSVCAHLGEAWRRRRYEGSFPPATKGDFRKSRLNDAEAEAAETQVWLELAVKYGHLDAETARDLYVSYDQIIGKIVQMITHPQHWTIGA